MIRLLLRRLFSVFKGMAVTEYADCGPAGKDPETTDSAAINPAVLCVALCFMMMLPRIPVYAKLAADPVTARGNVMMEKLTPSLQQKIFRSTPEEPESSDLRLVYGATRLATRRIPQGYTSDGVYYYFLSNLSSFGKQQSDLRLTRVRYLKDGTYDEEFMTLKGFGHGTNLDCKRSGGVTWLWTGSDPRSVTGPTTTISCFTFKKGKVLRKHAKIHYSIPLKGKNANATNCFPAISADGTHLAVRYVHSGKQYFKIYRLKKGKYINRKHPLKTLSISNTRGDFQGFDIKGTVLYTIEGTAKKAERKELHKKYYPIKIRTYDYKTGRRKTITVKGAKKLSHREPEGIQIDEKGRIFFGLASHYKDKYTCMNIYQYKFQ